MRPRPTALVRTTSALLCAGCAALPVLLPTAPAGAKVVDTTKKPAEGPPPPLILKYLGAQRMRSGGKDVMVVGGVDLMSGRTMQLAVPNNDEKSNKYDPKTEITEKLDTLKPGDYVKVESRSGSYGENWLGNIGKYEMKDGEEQPGNFVFYETYPKNDTTPPVQWVTLQKFGQTVDAVLPMKPNDKKQMETDPSLLATVNAFQKGDVVAVEVGPGNPPVIRGIDKYKAPEQAKMGKVVEADVVGDQKGPAVELDQDGKSLTLPIHGHLQGKKWQADPMLLSRAKSLKAGSTVLFSTHDEDGKTYLKDLKIAPAQPAAAGAGTGTAGKRFDKGK